MPSPTASPARFGVFALIGIGVWLHSVDTLVTATLSPSIVEELGGVAYINWTISLFEVGAIIAGAAAGALSARWGLKRVFVACALLYGVGCIEAAAATSMALVLLGRLVQGLGGGMLLSLCYVAIQAWYPQGAHGRLFGIVAAIWGAGSLLGPLIGGLFAHPHVWRWAFWLFAAQAVALGGAASALLPAEPRLRRAAERWPMVPLLLLTAATLVIAAAGVLSSAAACAAGLALGGALLYAAARLDQAAAIRLLPRHSLDARHPLGAGLLMVFALSTATTGFWAYGPLIVKVLFAMKPLLTGFILAGEALAWSLATLLVTSVSAAGERRLIRCGALCITAGASGFALAVPAGSLAGMIACAVLQGAGFGISWPAIVARTVRFADPAEEPLAAAAVPTVQRVGYAIGTAAAGIAANLSGLGQDMSSAAAKAAGFWVFAAFVPVLLVGLSSARTFTREAR